MNILKKTLSVLLLTAGVLQAKAQDQDKTNHIAQGSWIFSIGYNAVDDSGNDFKHVLKIRDNWNVMPMPSRVSIEKNICKSFSVSLIGSHNKFKAGKTINLRENRTPQNFYSIDLNAKYDLNDLIGQTKWFDPYVLVGLGYTVVGPVHEFKQLRIDTFNSNIGVGFNVWATDKIGLNIESAGKISFNGVGAHYKQHALSMIYKFGSNQDKYSAHKSKFVGHY